MNIRPIAVILFLLLFQSGGASKTSVAVFPLRNVSASELDNWIGYGITETISRKLYSFEGFHIWDPIFLFQTDSTGYEINADSLLKVHRTRWQWDIAVGGRYHIDADSLKAEILLLWATGREEPLKVDIELNDRVNDFFTLCDKAVLKILGVIQYKLTSRDSLMLRGIRYDFTAYRTLAAGYGYEMRGNLNAALTAYIRAEEIDPHYCAAAFRQALIYRKSNNFTQARSAFERAFYCNPEDPDITAEFADFLVECDVPAKAFKFINKHRNILEKTSGGMKVLGQMYMAAGEYQRAMVYFTKAVAFGPADLEAEFALGSAYSVTGDFSRASEIFNHLIQYRPYCLRYYASLGAAYRRVGRFMESSIVLESAEKFALENTAIQIELAHTYSMLGWYEKAEQLLLRAREISPLLSDIDVNLGVVYWYEGKKDDAVRCFDMAASNTTTRQSAFNNLGSVLFLGGSTKKAIQAYTKAEESGRKNETVLYNLAIAYLKENNLKKAARYLDLMLQMTPDRIDVLAERATIADTLKKYDDAERCYRRIIELVPDHEKAIHGLTAILLREKRYEEALQPLEDFLERQPLNREIMTLLASVYEKRGWFAAALMKYQAVIKAFPNDGNGYLGAGKCMYAMLQNNSRQDYDNAILVLKQAGEYAPRDPEPDVLMGNIYADCKGYRELAVDSWKKALDKTADKAMRKLLERKIAEKK